VKDAIAAFKKSLDTDPLMWCSYEKLCKLNPNAVDISKTFSDTNDKIKSFIKKVSYAMNSSIIEERSEKKNKDFNLLSPSPEENLKPNNMNNMINGLKSVESVKSQCQNKESNLFTIEENDTTKKKQMHSEVSNNKSGLYNNQNNISSINANINNVYNLFVNTINNTSQNSFSSNQKPAFNTPQAQLTKEYRVEHAQKNPENRPKFLVGSNCSLSPGPLLFNSNPGSSDSNNVLGNNQILKEPILNPFVLSVSNNSTSNIFNNSSNIICTPKEKQNILQEFNYQNKETSFSEQGKNNKNNNDGTINMFSIYDKSKFVNIAKLLRAFAEITKQINIFSNKEAMDNLNQLPNQYKKSGWVLSNFGKCFFELGRYKESEKIYQECLKREPYRLEGLDYFSTTLWHLKDQYQLCTLANHCLEQSHFQQETWIVVGNCYSLQRESEAALSFFKRSIQLNPYYSYAYTLCGHEFVEIENFQQAKVYYTQAIAYDER